MQMQEISATQIMIETLGFPIAAFVLMLALLYYTINKDEKRQDKSDLRYESLVKEFITTTKQITDEHNNALKEMTNEIKEITQELKIVATKLDETIKLRNEYTRVRIGNEKLKRITE